MEAAGRLFNTVAVKDSYGRPVLLFKNEFSLQQVGDDEGGKLQCSIFLMTPPEAPDHRLGKRSDCSYHFPHRTQVIGDAGSKLGDLSPFALPPDL